MKGSIMMRPIAGALACLVLAGPLQAREVYVGGPVQHEDMEIVANYLVGIEMAPMSPGMEHGDDVIHLEADVHATAENRMGFPDGAWIPALTIGYTLRQEGTDWHRTGVLRAMTAKDGPHYAWNVSMNGPGKYKLTYRFAPPEAPGFLRHVDEESGVPSWWAPFEESFAFDYPQR